VAVGAAGFREQIGEVLTFAGRLGDRLKPEIPYQPRAETFSLLYPHRIECASVGIYTDEKIVFGLKIL